MSAVLLAAVQEVVVCHSSNSIQRGWMAGCSLCEAPDGLLDARKTVYRCSHAEWLTLCYQVRIMLSMVAEPTA